MLTRLSGSNTPAEARPVSGRFGWRASDPFPWLGIGLAFAVSGLLLAFIGADPTRGITGSKSPFTDEAWNVLNARNLALLGTWSTDEFNLDLVNGPFSLLEDAGEVARHERVWLELTRQARAPCEVPNQLPIR
jgi:hypothetical protein